PAAAAPREADRPTDTRSRDPRAFRRGLRRSVARGFAAPALSTEALRPALVCRPVRCCSPAAAQTRLFVAIDERDDLGRAVRSSGPRLVSMFAATHKNDDLANPSGPAGD